MPATFCYDHVPLGGDRHMNMVRNGSLPSVQAREKGPNDQGPRRVGERVDSTQPVPVKDSGSKESQDVQRMVAGSPAPVPGCDELVCKSLYIPPPAIRTEVCGLLTTKTT